MKKILLGVFISVFLISCANKAEENATPATTTAADDTKKGGDELLPMSETDGIKNSLAAFSRGDLDGMTAGYADTCFMLWSSMDSLRGKNAIKNYYAGRWKMIDSIIYSDHILVPLKMNVQQSMFAPTGKWVLAWSFAHVKYKNGKRLDLWVHNVYHYNSANKIDFVGQYLDRHPIMEATKGM